MKLFAVRLPEKVDFTVLHQGKLSLLILSFFRLSNKFFNAGGRVVDGSVEDSSVNV